MATKVLSNQAFSGGAKITGLPVSSANGEPVVHEQLTAILGGLIFQTSWNASTDTPAIPAAAPANKGYYWIVSIAGATNKGGITDWQVGDWIVSDGATFQKIDNTEPAASQTVAGNIEIATTAEINAGTDATRAVTPAGLAAWSGRPLRFSQTIGDGVATSYAITHNLGTQDVHALTREVATNATVIVEWVATSTSVVTVTFATAPASNAYRTTILA